MTICECAQERAATSIYITKCRKCQRTHNCSNEMAPADVLKWLCDGNPALNVFAPCECVLDGRQTVQDITVLPFNPKEARR